MIHSFPTLTAFSTVVVCTQPRVMTQIKCIPQLCVDHVDSLTSAKRSTNFVGHQEQEENKKKKKMRKERKRNDNNDKHMDNDKDVMNDSHVSSNYLPSFLAHRKFLSGHNSAKVTYLCKFCRHQCIQGCKYSCACKNQ